MNELSIKALHDELEKSNAKLKVLEKSKEELCKMIMLDMYSLVMTIKNNLDVVMDKENIGEDIKMSVLSAQECSNELSTLILDFVGIEKLEDGALTLHFENTDMNMIISRSIEQMRLLAKKAAIALTKTSDDEILACDIDRSLILRTLINLILQAIKFTTLGGDIGIGGTPAGNQLRISVEYTGVGIPSECREKIFEKFAQIDIKPVNVMKGSELGLAFCKRAVEAHGGRIWVESEGNNKGNKFIFTIPKQKITPT